MKPLIFVAIFILGSFAGFALGFSRASSALLHVAPASPSFAPSVFAGGSGAAAGSIKDTTSGVPAYSQLLAMGPKELAQAFLKLGFPRHVVRAMVASWVLTEGGQIEFYRRVPDEAYIERYMQNIGLGSADLETDDSHLLFLSEADLLKVKSVNGQFRDRFAKIFSAMGEHGALDAAGVGMLESTRAERRKALEAQLGPIAFRELELRTSPLAARLRGMGVEWDENTFRATFDVLQNFPIEPDSASDIMMREQALAAKVGQKIANDILGCLDPNFASDYAFASKNGINVAEIAAIRSAFDDAERKILAADMAENQTAVQATIEKLRSQAMVALRQQVLREDQIIEYSNTPSGSFLKRALQKP